MREKFFMIVFVLVLGTILSSLITGVTYYTKPIIEKNIELKIKGSILDAFTIEHTKDNMEDVFLENIKLIEKEGKIFYINNTKDVAFEISGSGLWGPIDGVIALKPDLKTIKGITIIHQEETPGLGGRIAEKAFLLSFNNKEIVPSLAIVAPGKASKINEVDGITGATMSSKAFERIINSQIKEYVHLIELDEVN